MKIGVYPGSFDPFTQGHMDILVRAARTLDRVYVAVLRNPSKSPLFSASERVEMIKNLIESRGIDNALPGSFEGLLVDYAQSVDATVIVRGLRAVTDFEYEFQIDTMNRRLAPQIDTLYFMASAEHSFLSSSMIKEVATFGGSISGLVPHENENLILERLIKR